MALFQDLRWSSYIAASAHRDRDALLKTKRRIVGYAKARRTKSHYLNHGSLLAVDVVLARRCQLNIRGNRNRYGKTRTGSLHQKEDSLRSWSIVQDTP